MKRPAEMADSVFLCPPVCPSKFDVLGKSCLIAHKSFACMALRKSPARSSMVRAGDS